MDVKIYMGMRYSEKDVIKGLKGNELRDKKITLCVTGSVAIYRAIDLARELIKHDAEVYTVMSQEASKYINPIVFEWATGNPVVTEMSGKTEHISLGEESDLLLIAPATGNTIAKIASGIADTTVTLTVSVALGSDVPLLIVPAMHEPMYKNPVLKESIEKLKELGVYIVEPSIEENKAKFPDIEIILNEVFRLLYRGDLRNKRILVTGGATIEYIDPVRVITNRSSGKMGVEIAREAYVRGAEVTLVLGRSLVAPPKNVNVLRVDTTEDLLNTVLSELDKHRYDAYISAAAPVDFTPLEKFERKLDSRSKEILKLELGITPKVVEKVRERYSNLNIVAFKAVYNLSDEEIINKATKFARELGLNLVVANDLARRGAGFEVDTNEVFIVDRNGLIEHIPLSSKRDIARKILDHLVKLIK